MTPKPTGPELTDAKMDRLMKAAGREWCDQVAPPESRFVEEFERRLQAELARPRPPARARVVPVEPRPRRWILSVSAAACLAVVAGVGALLLRRPSPGIIEFENRETAFEGPRALKAGERLVYDEDCSGILALGHRRVVVYVHPDTQLQVVSANQVHVDRGAVWVVIQPNSGLFAVETPDGVAQVQGTTFGVTVGDHGCEVVVMSGQVIVGPGRAPLGSGCEVQILLPEQAALMPKGGGPAQVSLVQAKTPDWVSRLQTEADRIAPAGR